MDIMQNLSISKIENAPKIKQNSKKSVSKDSDFEDMLSKKIEDNKIKKNKVEKPEGHKKTEPIKKESDDKEIEEKTTEKEEIKPEKEEIQTKEKIEQMICDIMQCMNDINDLSKNTENNISVLLENEGATFEEKLNTLLQSTESSFESDMSTLSKNQQEKIFQDIKNIQTQISELIAQDKNNNIGFKNTGEVLLEQCEKILSQQTLSPEEMNNSLKGFKEELQKEFENIKDLVTQGEAKNANLPESKANTLNMEQTKKIEGTDVPQIQRMPMSEGTIEQNSMQYVLKDNQAPLNVEKIEEPNLGQPKFPQIVKQVSDKIEVMIGEKRSEMSLQLEPENLGKLSMKIAVEKGIVMAKIVAESQIVKEVIESNFKMLKDSLEEKGFNIQQLDVSVGQDNSQENHNRFMNFNKKNNKKSKGKFIEDGMNEQKLESINDTHSINESKINQLG
ncbi:flagellar hook-length control protein FliK [Lutibacter sp. B2]|nr:flagellar hook-length control protein FliK [Lutibacter sp. B2]